MSNTDATSLLRALSAGIRPDAKAPTRPALSLHAQSFAQLLQGATRLDKPSGRPIESAPGVDAQLSQDEQDRLGMIIDNAEVNGSTRLAVLHGGEVLHIDVLTRTIERIEPFDADRVLTDIDALARLEADPDAPSRQLTQTDSIARTAAGMFGVRNASLAALLGSVANAIDPDQNESNDRNQAGAA